MNKCTVLLVEDDKAVLQYLKYFLKDHFRSVYSANNGMEGLVLYEHHLPDVIFADINMPVMDGIEFIREIRRKNSLAPIVVATGTEAEGIDALNVQKVLRKPFSPEQLLQVIKGLL